jgi:copper oxidase (laccase) domain-containing protein
MASFKVIAGVGLRQCCFEVGEDFKSYDNFKEFVKPREGKLFFDPVGFARKKLSGKGLKPENFIDLDICSFCSKENFFSNRKDGTDNRTLSFVMKNK